MTRPRPLERAPLARAMLAVFCFLALLTYPAGAVWAAACEPGLPCDVPLTPNPDPLNEDIGPNDSGPNAPDAPNEPKSGQMGESRSCDADFMNQIYGRAFLEAERATVTASAIMLKPDSVLEYTCFDQLASHSVNAITPIFAEDAGLTDALGIVVMDVLNEYIDSNFDHDFLGGAAEGDDNTIAGGITGIGVCEHMYNVFFIAKCSDFALEAPYMSFEELIETDPRQLPRECPDPTAITQEIIDLANNVDFEYVAFDSVSQPYSRGVGVLDRMRAVEDGACLNDVPIQTGVTVYYQQFGQDIVGRPITLADEEYSDAVCTNPGCYYDREANECVP